MRKRECHVRMRRGNARFCRDVTLLRRRKTWTKNRRRVCVAALSPLPRVVSSTARNWLPGAAGPDTPVANLVALMPRIPQLLSGALFLSLYELANENGRVFLLPTGMSSSFLVVSDPSAAKEILRGYPLFEKGLVREVSEFLFGDGFAVAEREKWKMRRKVMLPSLHKAYLKAMVERVFAPCSHAAVRKLEAVIANGAREGDGERDDANARTEGVLDMEALYSQLTLDIIGKAVFNYDFDSLGVEGASSASTADAENVDGGLDGSRGVIDAVYAALKETEMRTTDLLPTWKIGGALGEAVRKLDARQVRATEAVQTIRDTVERLIRLCREDVAASGTRRAEKGADEEDDFVDDVDPSILRFLLAAETQSTSEDEDGNGGGVQHDEAAEDAQLRDDLLSVLVAGHETTGAVLTWTTYLLAQNPAEMRAVQAELDEAFGTVVDDQGSAAMLTPSVESLRQLPYLSRCIAESMRLYPHPPVLIRRATKEVTLPGGQRVPAGQDIIVSVYNIHRDPANWDDPDAFLPSRFPLDEPLPNEVTTDFRYIPFSAGPRKCVGDTFALLEATVALAVLLKRFDFEVVEGQNIELTTGATIHALNGIYMRVSERRLAPVVVA